MARVIPRLSSRHKKKGGEIMTDIEKYKSLVDDSGLKKKYIAERLGLTYAGYLKKENGETEFVASELGILKGLFGLTDKQVGDIFLVSE